MVLIALIVIAVVLMTLMVLGGVCGSWEGFSRASRRTNVLMFRLVAGRPVLAYTDRAAQRAADDVAAPSFPG